MCKTLLFKLIICSMAFAGPILLSKPLSAQGTVVRSITVQGESRKMVEPNEVAIMFGIETRDIDVANAHKNNAQAVRKVLNLLKDFKIAERDIQTTFVQLSPQIQHHYPERTGTQDKPIIYVARKEMRILLRDIQKYERLLTGLIQNGVNQIQQIQFLHSDETKFKNEARLLALRHAKEKAQAMVNELGSQLGETLAIQEGAIRSHLPVPMAFEARTMSEDSSSTTLAVGELAIEAVVSVSFSIK